MKLEEVAPWGRTLAEYQLMFDLSETDLNTKILGCGDEPKTVAYEFQKGGNQLLNISR